MGVAQPNGDVVSDVIFVFPEIIRSDWFRFSFAVSNFSFISFKLFYVENSISWVSFVCIRRFGNNEIIDVIPKRVQSQLEQHFFVKERKTIVNFWF